MTKTHLIIVSGAPASGKTLLAQELRDALNIPLLSKDVFKEVLMDASPPANREESGRIGQSSWPVLNAAASQLVGYIPGLILEANFRTRFTESQLDPIIRQCRTTLIHCHTDRETTLTRIESRKVDPDRHPGHFDQEALPILFDLIENDAYRLDLPGVPTIEVDTTNGYQPTFAEILHQLQSD